MIRYLFLGLIFTACTSAPEDTRPSGLPPELLNAWLDYDFFYYMEVLGHRAEPMDEAFRSQMRQRAQRYWNALSAGQRQQLQTAAPELKLWSRRWAQARPEERLFIKARLAGPAGLDAYEQGLIDSLQLTGTVDTGRVRAWSDQLLDLRRLQQRLTGVGTRYNPQMGRWQRDAG